MDRADVFLQVAGRPERHAIAVAAGVVPALLVHNLDMFRQGALLPEGARTVGARVVPALLVHRLDVRLQVALRPEGDALAVGARVVPALLVHRLDVHLQAASVFVHLPSPAHHFMKRIDIIELSFFPFFYLLILRWGFGF